MATSGAPPTGGACETGYVAVLVRWSWQTTGVMVPRGLAHVVEVPRRLPAGLMPACWSCSAPWDGVGR
jgi:hypothetical protein